MYIGKETYHQAYGAGRDGFVVENAPEYDIRRIRALQNKRHRRSAVYQKHVKSQESDLVYRWRVFQEQTRRQKY